MDQADEQSNLDEGSQPGAELDLEGIAGDLDESGEEEVLQPEGQELQTEQTDDESWKERKTRVTIDGQEQEITIGEALNGYMRQSDYTRKTQEAARELTQAQAMKTQVEQELAQRANQLGALTQALYQELVGDQAKLAELIESNPQEYLRQQARMAQKAQLLSQAQQQQQALQAQANNEQAARHADLLQKSEQMLVNALPDWKDPAKRQSMQKDIREYLEGVGYTAQEIDGLADHRAVLVAHKAALWDKSQALASKKAVQQPPAAIRPGSAGKPDNAAISQAADRARRNPTSLDALAGYAFAKGGI